MSVDAGYGSGLPPRRVRVLWVDEDPAVGLAMRRIAKTMHIHLQPVMSSNGMRSVLARSRFDWIVVNELTFAVDGIMLAELAKHGQGGQRIALVVDRQRVEHRTLGFQIFVRPASPSDLLRALTR